MMDCYDVEAPSMYEVKIRKARKAHLCCECNRYIAYGVKYEEARGLWDGSWASYKTCGFCVDLRQALLEYEGCDCFVYGGLPDEICNLYLSIESDTSLDGRYREDLLCMMDEFDERRKKDV